jgi:hypothetical protein
MYGGQGLGFGYSLNGGARVFPFSINSTGANVNGLLNANSLAIADPGTFIVRGSSAALNRFSILTNGNVGVGITNPTNLFQVGTALNVNTSGNVGIGAAPNANRLQVGNGFNINAAGLTTINSANVTSSIELGNTATLKIQNGAGTGKVLVSDATGMATWQTPAPVSTSSWSRTAYNNRYLLHTADFVNIGPAPYLSTNVLNDYRLAVDGHIICTEARVRLRSAWPDYVFDDNYALTPIQELAQYIKTNKHLPEMPSAAVVEKEGGFDTGEHGRMLLQKVEELTLYLIQQQAKIEALEAQINSLTPKK